MKWQDGRQIDTLEFIARATFTRLFNPGADVPGEDWTDFITTVCGKPEADFTALDWRKVRDVMRHYLPPPGVIVNPSPFCVWYANAHGFPAE